MEQFSLEETDGGPMIYVRDDSGGLAVLTDGEARLLYTWLWENLGPNVERGAGKSTVQG